MYDRLTREAKIYCDRGRDRYVCPDGPPGASLSLRSLRARGVDRSRLLLGHQLAEPSSIARLRIRETCICETPI